MKRFEEKHPWGIRVALVLFGFMASLIIGEVAVRVLEYYQYRKLSDRYDFEQYKKVYKDERGEDYVFGHKEGISVRLERGDYAFTFVTNSEGLRETKDYTSLDKSVIFLGDSIVEGVSVENHEVMDEIFERETGIVALNFGLGSSNTVHQLHWLKSKYKESYNTRLVVLGFCLNDLRQNVYLRYFDPSLGNWALYRYLSDGEEDRGRKPLRQQAVGVIKKSRLAVFTYNSVQNMLAEKKLPPFRADQVNDEQKHYTELYIEKIREFSERIGAEFVVVIFPQESQLGHDYTSHERMQEVLIGILEKNEIPYLDLYDVLKRHYRAQPEVRWFHDDTHPYQEGHRLIGEYLARELPEMFPAVFE